MLQLLLIQCRKLNLDSPLLVEYLRAYTLKGENISFYVTVEMKAGNRLPMMHSYLEAVKRHEDIVGLCFRLIGIRGWR